ncbi:MAG: hypothetical protein OXN94_00765 [Chloroflexota bacterium]|nr:hypothetical protein [Chloroflexota bacterium]
MAVSRFCNAEIAGKDYNAIPNHMVRSAELGVHFRLLASQAILPGRKHDQTRQLKFHNEYPSREAGGGPGDMAKLGRVNLADFD